MNAIFDSGRFFLLLKNRVVENKRKYLLYFAFMAALAVVLLILFFSFSHGFLQYSYYFTPDLKEQIFDRNDHWEEFQEVAFWVGLLISGGLFASSAFVNFHNQGEGIFYINKPGSTFEKWLVEFTIHVVLFSLLFIGLFYLLAIPSNAIINSLAQADFDKLLNGRTDYLDKSFGDPTTRRFHPEIIRHSVFLLEGEENFNGSALFPFFFLWTYIVFGFVMFGAILFNRFAFFKTCLLAFGLFLIFLVVLPFTEEMTIPSGWSYSLGSTGAYQNNYGNADNQGGVVHLDENWVYWGSLVFSILVFVWIHACTFLTLKNKRV
jgi:hypothetical protein